MIALGIDPGSWKKILIFLYCLSFLPFSSLPKLENGLCRIVTGRYSTISLGWCVLFLEGAPFWKDYPSLLYFLVSFTQSGRNTIGKGVTLRLAACKSNPSGRANFSAWGTCCRITLREETSLTELGFCHKPAKLWEMVSSAYTCKPRVIFGFVCLGDQIR